MAPRILTALLLAICAACGGEDLRDGGTWNTAIAGKPFRLTVSASDETRQQGLGGVKEIAEDGGMVFVFPRAEPRSFWMKGCVVDMDILFLDPMGFITAIHTMKRESPRHEGEPQVEYEARLARYPSVLPAQYAIELRAGRAKELGLATQQRVRIDGEALKAALR